MRAIVARGPTKLSADTPSGSSAEVFDALYKKGSAAKRLICLNASAS